MLLHRLHLNLRCKEVRRDLADPYEMHSTLCRAFCPPEKKCPEGEFLWRLEPETDPVGNPRVLVQSRNSPDWSRIGIRDWLAMEPEPALDLASRLKLASLADGQRFRYRLRANPSVKRNGKRLGLLGMEEQINWLRRKGEAHGFSLETVHISQERMLSGKRHDGSEMRVFSVLLDGVLATKDTEKFREVIASGIGHGKALGLGLLSVVPMS